MAAVVVSVSCNAENGKSETTSICLAGKEFRDPTSFRIAGDKLRFIHREGIGSIPIPNITLEEIEALPASIRAQIGNSVGSQSLSRDADAEPGTSSIGIGREIPLDSQIIEIGGTAISDAISATLTDESINIKSTVGTKRVPLYAIAPEELKALPKNLLLALEDTMLFPLGNTSIQSDMSDTLSGTIQQVARALLEHFDIYLSIDPQLDPGDLFHQPISLSINRGQNVFSSLTSAVAARTADLAIFPLKSNLWFVGRSSAHNIEMAKLAFSRRDREALMTWAARKPQDPAMDQLLEADKMLADLDNCALASANKIMALHRKEALAVKSMTLDIQCMSDALIEIKKGLGAMDKSDTSQARDPARIGTTGLAVKQYQTALLRAQTVVPTHIGLMESRCQEERDLSEQAQAIELQSEQQVGPLSEAATKLVFNAEWGISAQIRRSMALGLKNYSEARAQLNRCRKDLLAAKSERMNTYKAFVEDVLEGVERWPLEVPDPRGHEDLLSSEKLEYLGTNLENVAWLEQLYAVLTKDRADETIDMASLLSIGPTRLDRQNLTRALTRCDPGNSPQTFRARVETGLILCLGSYLQERELPDILRGKALSANGKCCLEDAEMFLSGQKELGAVLIGRGRTQQGTALGLAVRKQGEGTAAGLSEFSVTLEEAQPSGKSLREMLPAEWNVVLVPEIYCSFVGPDESPGLDTLVSLRDAVLWAEGRQSKVSEVAVRFPVMHFDKTLFLRDGLTGDSAGLAFGAALHSAYRGNRGNSKVAVTGAIHPNGAVRAVSSGVGKRIEGAVNAGCHYVIIPNENASCIYGLDTRTLLGIQVIAVKDAMEALPFLSLGDKAEDFIAAVGAVYWGAVSLLCDGKSEAAAGALDMLLAKVPRHLSARRLRDFLKKTAPGAVPERLKMLAERELAHQGG